MVLAFYVCLGIDIWIMPNYYSLSNISFIMIEIRTSDRP